MSGCDGDFIPNRYADIHEGSVVQNEFVTYQTHPGFTFTDDTTQRSILCDEGSWHTNWEIVSK